MAGFVKMASSFYDLPRGRRVLNLRTHFGGNKKGERQEDKRRAERDLLLRPF
jgi:hypothetical protein